MKELDLTRKQVQKDMKELQEMHIIEEKAQTEEDAGLSSKRINRI